MIINLNVITKNILRWLNIGNFYLEYGRNRSGTFELKVVSKRKLIFT